MDQALSVEEVLPDISFDVYLVLAEMADFTEHVATVFFPSDFLRESNSNLSQDCIRIGRELTIIDVVQHHELILVRELRCKHSLKQFLDLALLTRRDVFEMLQHTD